MDTGADVTIINSQSWPTAWLARPVSTALIGLSFPQSVSQSAMPLPYIDPDGKTGITIPFIARIPINLWRRGLMEEWGHCPRYLCPSEEHSTH